MPRPPLTAPEYWDLYKPHRGEGEQPPPEPSRFEWTPFPGHGPKAEVLGTPCTALELGPGEGADAVHLARLGIEVTAVDFSAFQIERARRWWCDEPGVRFVHADVCEFLIAEPAEYDAIYSMWGAVWFTDPEQLLPLVAKRLAPGGVFVFGHAEPAPGTYGPQRMRGKWLEGRDRELTVLRWQYTPDMWADLLKRNGFTHVHTRVVPPPGSEPLGTLLVRAGMV
ncbi:bifunctional 2-polyprenyl-6-hydroxyphenol methylase/3-demethylubiquinol 3-O-methyltransferase UbiG [Streptomyces sp. UNOC14_S4]|uniref:class I SAM-dependent methyltransferase n=1 Tax=Streptomyces sp. UNOC14_S4 TaxID=2872340 RepID=UPI001E28CD40|nr:class I SAM-dependent methyltransferase [Streptomyces sp. UNOC14_S4]MCC3767067.1 methyltransferase domain-containing protein [Streptomyces sp. UNOC14_S4]